MLRWLSIGVLISLGPAAMSESDDPPLFQRHYEAGSRPRVSIRARVGNILVQPSTDGAVHVSVTLASRDTSRLAGCVATASLDDDGRAGDLALSVTQRQRKQCGEEWIVRTPARSILDLRIDVGDITVEGMVFGGDVSARAEVGDVTLAIDGARVAPSRSGAGERVKIDGEGGNALRLSSRVGDVRVKLTR